MRMRSSGVSALAEEAGLVLNVGFSLAFSERPRLWVAEAAHRPSLAAVRAALVAEVR